MSKLLNLFLPKGKDGNNKSGEDRWAKSKTAGSTSETTVLANKTDKTLVLRDKVGAAYGATRYTIPGKSEMKVTTLQHTFFKMLAYAIVEEDEEGASSNMVTEDQDPAASVTPQELHNKTKKKKKSVDTKLTIDSDQLADYRRIEISSDGSEYKLNFVSSA